MFADLVADLRYAIRLSRRSPTFTAVALLSLAIGIGANTAIFSLVDALMLKKLPVRDPGRLVLVQIPPSADSNYARFEQFRDAAAAVVDLCAIARTDRYNVVLGPHASVDPGPVRAAMVSPNYFATMGASAAIGRTFTAEEDGSSGGRAVVVISHEYWRHAFASAPDIVGRTLTINDTVYEVAGVMPAAFTGEWIGRPADLWVPIAMQARILVETPVALRTLIVTVVGRLKPTVSLAQAEAVLQPTFEQTQREEAGRDASPERRRQIVSERIKLEPAARGVSAHREAYGTSLTILMIAVGIVLLIACANLASLLLARSAARQREIAVRLAIGSGRMRIIRQLLTESVLLASAGGAVGLLFAEWAAGALASFVRSGHATNVVALSMDLDVHLDGRMLAFTGATCLVTGILFGIVPAFRASTIALSRSLGGRRTDSGAGPLRLGKLLVVSQVGLSLVLLVGAGLFARTLRNLTTRDLGFERDRLLLVWTLPGQSSGRGAAAADFWQTVRDRVASVPGVISASASNQGVINGSDLSAFGRGSALRVEGEPLKAYGLPALRSFVAPGFFATMGIRLMAGRDFTERDTESAPRVAIISDSMARHYFGDRSAIGHRVWFPEDTATPTEIVGVVGDFTTGTPREIERRHPTYFSYRDREAARRLRYMMLAVRTTGDPVAMTGRIRQALREAAPNLPVLRINTVEQQVSDVLVQERLIAALSSFFGAVALLLASLGLYGVIAYSVARRTSEIGIRMALGATPAGVLRAILGESLVLVAAGLLVGALAAIAVTRFAAARLFGISPADPLTMIGAMLLMTAVAALAAFVPARRASQLDPMLALRAE